MTIELRGGRFDGRRFDAPASADFQCPVAVRSGIYIEHYRPTSFADDGTLLCDYDGLSRLMPIYPLYHVRTRPTPR